jgi:hypothetical protein
MNERRRARRRTRVVQPLLAVLLSVCANRQPANAEDAAGAAEQVSDATITLRGHAAAVGLGFVWGGSTLDFRGQQYPVRLDGFVLGAVGAIAIEARGQVYGLTKAEDLNGDFTALGRSGAFGIGASKLVMRNEKGVRVVFDARISGLELGLGPRALTLEVGEAGGPPASHAARLPQTLGFGAAKYGALSLRPTLNLQLAGWADGNSGFGGTWSAGPVQDADVWFETSNEAGLNALYDAGHLGTLKARISGVFSLTGGGVDAAASNGPEVNNNQYSLENAYLTWQSGNLFPSLGFNAVEVGGGNQNYQVFDGFLFWDGAPDGGVRGASWITPRKAFRETAIARLNLGAFSLEGAHLKLNDDPDTGTRLGLARIEVAADDLVMKHFKAGFVYANVYESKQASRDGLNLFYFYHEGTPFPPLPDFTYTMSFAEETNSESSGLSSATGWFIAPAYALSELPWAPQMFYRYASFSGGGTNAFDPLFTGLSDWGTWTQGELLGEFVVSNSNLNSHQVRLKLQPNDTLTLNLIYYKFLLDDRDQSFGVTPSRVSSNALADEVDMILDASLANWWSVTVELTLAVPDQGFREAVGGSSTWINSMLYTNFNF